MERFPPALPGWGTKRHMEGAAVGRPMTEKAILRTLGELDRWRRREGELRAELEKAQRQVQYYEALAGDMKRETRPVGVADLLRSFVKP